MKGNSNKDPRRSSKEALIYRATQQKRGKHIMDEKLHEKKMWIHYILQSLLATVTLLIVMLILQFATIVIVAALGSTAFIVFAMPKNITAQPRNVVGGHIMGIISGAAFALFLINQGFNSDINKIIAASASVGLSIFIMVVTDTEHPPGCSTALGLVVHASDNLDVLRYAGFILIAALIIAGVKHVLDPKLKDLV